MSGEKKKNHDDLQLESTPSRGVEVADIWYTSLLTRRPCLYFPGAPKSQPNRGDKNLSNQVTKKRPARGHTTLW